MPRARLDDKFVRIHKFVTEKTNRDKTNTGTFLIEDDDILNFLATNSTMRNLKSIGRFLIILLYIYESLRGSRARQKFFLTPP